MNTAIQIAKMVDMLPEDDRQLAFELVKRIVLAWDADFTRLTPQERESVEQAEREIVAGEYVTDEEINWD